MTRALLAAAILAISTATHAEIVDNVLPKGEVDRICTQVVGHMAPLGYDGCSIIKANVCYIWRIMGDEVEAHERAHCAGWPGTHPGWNQPHLMQLRHQ